MYTVIFTLIPPPSPLVKVKSEKVTFLLFSILQYEILKILTAF